MTSPPDAKASRPLSPHLQIYKPQLTSGLSIFHRLTGIALAAGLPVFVLWLLAAATGQQNYACFTRLAQSAVGQILLFGWSWAFFFHLCTGIRHLFWDAGLFLDLKNAYRTGYIALGVSTLLTLGTWAKIIWGMQ